MRLDTSGSRCCCRFAPSVHCSCLCRVPCPSGSGRERDMAREKDPAEIIETIAQSIRVSQRGARKVRAHRFKELFGYQALSAQRRERIERLMAEAGIVVRPSL